MVRIHRTQRFPLGTRVSKYFNGFTEPFRGTVDQHSDVTDFYHVSYDDGDSEEMTENDVETHFLTLPNDPRALKASKPQILELNTVTTPPLAKKSNALLQMKRATSENNINVSSLPPVTVDKRNSRRKSKILSLNANAPGLARSNSFTGSFGSSDKTLESSRISMPKETFGAVGEQEKAEEEEIEEVAVEDEEEKEKEDESAVDDEEEEAEEEEEEEEEIAIEDEEEDSLSEGTPEEINQLIGKPVERSVAKEGTVLDIVQGTVASYFPATKMFRVMYFDGECSDLTYYDVLNSIPEDTRSVEIRKKTKRKVEDTLRNKAKDGSSSASSAPPKRLKTLELNAKGIAPLKCSGSPSSPSIPNTPVADMSMIDNVEFNIVRKVLYIIVSTVNCSMMEAQLNALSSANLKDEEALKVFVQKDGLISLAELLTKWDNQVETEQGLLLVLKVLAILPGITKNAIMESGIGKKVRLAEKRGTYKDSSIPGLAAWVIQKMKADVGAEKEDRIQRKKINENISGYLKTRSEGARRSTSDSPRGDVKQDDYRADLESTVRPQLGNLKTSSSCGSSCSIKQSNSADHLHTLMNSRTGRDASTARRDLDIFGKLLTGQNKRKLGTARNWRARRSTVVLDQVTRRVAETTQEVVIPVAKAVEDDDWRPSKISFAEKDSVCPFDKEVEVSKLLIFRFSGSLKAPERLIAKPQKGNLRSILRVRLPTDSTRQPRPQDSNIGLSTVPETGRPELEPIVVPSQRSSPTLSDKAEDGTLESPMFVLSRLSNVVSPTEKRKQGFSPPPCIPTSEQPPLGFTEIDKEGDFPNESEMSANDRKADALLEDNEDSQPVETVKAATPVLSPVVSEDESSDEDEASLNRTDDSALEAEAATPVSCLTGSKGGGETAMEASVQQVTTTSA